MKKIFVFILFCFFSFSLYSQSNNNDKLSILKETKFKIYWEEVKINNYIKKSTVLDRIEQEFSLMKYSKDDILLIELLIYLTEEGTERRIYNGSSSTITNDFPTVRERAVILLGKIGGDLAFGRLIEIIGNMQEMNIRVLYDVLDSLQNVDQNNAQDALDAILQRYDFTSKKSQQFIYALISCISQIGKKNNVNFSQLVNFLGDLSINANSRFIKDAATNYIKEIVEK